jgi:hypothetical protein
MYQFLFFHLELSMFHKTEAPLYTSFSFCFSQSALFPLALQSFEQLFALVQPNLIQPLAFQPLFLS